MNRRETGREGERLARRHLERLGYRVLDLNHRTRIGELDIVCEDDRTIVFVEVKARTSTDFGEPAEAVDLRKQAKLRRLAEEYLIEHGLEDHDARFDVLSVRLGAGDPVVEHLKGAF